MRLPVNSGQKYSNANPASPLGDLLVRLKNQNERRSMAFALFVSLAEDSLFVSFRVIRSFHG